MSLVMRDEWKVWLSIIFSLNFYFRFNISVFRKSKMKSLPNYQILGRNETTTAKRYSSGWYFRQYLIITGVISGVKYMIKLH